MVFAIILAVLLLISAVALVITVIFQSNGKSAKLSASIAGGSSDTFLGKNKQYGRDKKLAKMTMIIAIIFVVLVLATSIYTARTMNDGKDGGAADTTTAATTTTAGDTTVADDTTDAGTDSTTDTNEAAGTGDTVDSSEDTTAPAEE